MLLYTTFSYRTRNVIFLTQAGTDIGGCYVQMQTYKIQAYTETYTQTHPLIPSQQTAEIRVCQEKVCYRTDQNPWNQQSI